MSSYDYGHNTPDDTPSGKKQTESEILSWLLIFFCFAIFWPLGLFLLIRKLSDGGKKTRAAARQQNGASVPPGWAVPGQTGVSAQKKETVPRQMMKTPSMKKGTRLALKLVGFLLAAGGLLSAGGTITNMIFYPPIYRWDVMALLQESALAGAGILMLVKGVSMDRASKRYTQYLAIIGTAQSIAFSQLSAITGRDMQKVIDDLDRMIGQGYFGPTAYLDLSLGYFFRSRTAAEEAAAKKRAEAATPKEAEEGYAGVLRSIRRANDRIADAALSAKIDRLEEVTAQIFRAIEKDGKKASQVRTFLEYYLPTTQKLLDSYAEFEAAGIEGENLHMAKEKIEDTMDNIVRGFERQLDALYAAEAMDIQSDIDVMNSMMQRDSAMHTSDFQVSCSSSASAAAQEEKQS